MIGLAKNVTLRREENGYKRITCAGDEGQLGSRFLWNGRGTQARDVAERCFDLVRIDIY